MVVIQDDNRVLTVAWETVCVCVCVSKRNRES